MTEPDDGLSPLARAMQAAAPWLAAVSKLTGGAVLGVVAGYFIDQKMGWSPWGLVVCSVVCISVGMYGFLKDALNMGKKK